METNSLTYRVSGPVQIPDSLLTQLVNRLEAATSRLEDIASSTAGFEVAQARQSDGATQSGAAAASTPSDPAATPNAGATPSQPKPASTNPPAIESFDALIRDDLTIWFDLSNQLGGVIAEQVSSLLPLFTVAPRPLRLYTRLAHLLTRT